MQRWTVLILCLGLTACYDDPFKNPNDWSATGATQRNIAVQVANPSDLISGKSDAYSNGAAASAGIGKALDGAAGVLVPPPPATMNITGS